MLLDLLCLFQATVMLAFFARCCVGVDCLESFFTPFFAACALPVFALLLFLRADCEIQMMACHSHDGGYLYALLASLSARWSIGHGGWSGKLAYVFSGSFRCVE